MADASNCVQVLRTGAGERAGVYIPMEIWKEAEAEVMPLLQAAYLRVYGAQEAAEPLQDWELLVANWDFAYPVDTHVHCGQCGNVTLNWQEDEPRKFRLKAAGLGGLVAFACCVCGAKIVKRHFKDEIKMETVARK